LPFYASSFIAAPFVCRLLLRPDICLAREISGYSASPYPGLEILICIWEKFGRRWAFFLFQSASACGPQMRENLRRSSQSGQVIAPILSSSPSIIQAAAANFDWLWTAERKITQKSKLPPKTTYRRSE